ncbi:MAG: enoyl-CoA hydratase, partial [Dehalococcoidia bacterium]|nr:enoyl-CoA hydratase [Dehalococcoidia bacterium]
VENFAKRFTVNSGAIVSLQRKIIVATCEKPPEEAEAETRKLRAEGQKLEDCKEGATAFREKRPPQWKHR